MYRCVILMELSCFCCPQIRSFAPHNFTKAIKDLLVILLCDGLALWKRKSPALHWFTRGEKRLDPFRTSLVYLCVVLQFAYYKVAIFWLRKFSFRNIYSNHPRLFTCKFPRTHHKPLQRVNSPCWRYHGLNYNNPRLVFQFSFKTSARKTGSRRKIQINTFKLFR